jgi:hypothetical protein
MESEHDGVRYINSGTWTDYPPCPFVVVEGSEVRLEHWPIAEAHAVPEPPTEGAESEAVPAHPQVLPPALPAMG